MGKINRKRNDSKFVRNSKCHVCGSRKGLAIYSDHEYCFACGHTDFYEDKGNRTMLLLENKMEPIKENPLLITLPDDACNLFSEEGLAWLRKYDITDEDIINNHICWSESRKSVIFPFYDCDGNLVMWQARLFRVSSNPSVVIPKYYTRGHKKSDFLPIFFYERDGSEDMIVLVEDILSAIKVSRVKDALPLLGSVIDKQLLSRLSKLYSNIYIWLDKDKQDTYKKYISYAKILFSNVYFVYTDLDPKEYNATIIKEFLDPNWSAISEGITPC